MGILKKQMDPNMLEKIRPQFRDNIDIIEREFTKAGLPIEFAAGALANVWHESKFNHAIRSGYPGEDSVGLFQLNITGAGAGMVEGDGTDLRMDPVLNTQRIIEEVNSKYGKQMRAAYDEGERRVSVYAGLFCRYIERPGSYLHCMENRGPTAIKFFPSDKVHAGIPRWVKITGITVGATIGLLGVYALASWYFDPE